MKLCILNGTQETRKDTGMTHYPPDLIEKQWQVIPKILEPQARNRKHPFKEVTDTLHISKQLLNFSDKFVWQIQINV